MKEITRPSTSRANSGKCNRVDCGSHTCEVQICDILTCNKKTCDVLECNGLVSAQIVRPANLPDLVPVETNPLFCNLDNQGRLIVTVKNQGASSASPTVTRVIFENVVDPGNAIFDQFTPVLAPGEKVDLDPVPVPPVTGTDINFTITVNFGNLIIESNTDNNTVSGACIG